VVSDDITGEETVYFTEFGGQRVQNETQCTIDGYSCASPGPAACMAAPGRNYTSINNCQCGCDVFHQMGSGHRVRVVHVPPSGHVGSGGGNRLWRRGSGDSHHGIQGFRGGGGVVETVCGSGVRGYRDGPSAQAEFNHPYDVALLGTSGDLVIADALNHVVRLYTAATKTVSTLVGNGTRGWRDNADARKAGLNYPTGLAVQSGAEGDAVAVYIADRGNNCIRRYTIASRALDTIAGDCNGGWGYADGMAMAARFSGPTQLALVPASTLASSPAALYITDAANDAVRVVSGIGTPTATVATLRADLGGVRALSMPQGIAADPLTGSLFVSSYLGGTLVEYSGLDGARAVAAVVIAGSGGYAFADGVGRNATFKGPKGLAWSPARGRLLVGDLFNMRIRTACRGNATGAAAARVVLQPMVSPPSASVATQPQLWGQRAVAASDAPGAAADPIRVLIWSGHSGPYHDHFAHGVLLAAALNANSAVPANATLACFKDETTPCEAVFASPTLRTDFDVILILADTYENPDRGSLTTAEWEGLFAFVQVGGGGLFALHTASACWDHIVEDPTDAWSHRFHHEMLNCEFGGHSPYKDYISTVIDPVNDPITAGLSSYAVTDELYFPKVPPPPPLSLQSHSEPCNVFHIGSFRLLPPSPLSHTCARVLTHMNTSCTHPRATQVYDRNRSTIFLTAYDRQQNISAVHGLRHSYGAGRVLYFAQGHDMAEYENPADFTGNHAFQVVVTRCLQWLAKHI